MPPFLKTECTNCGKVNQYDQAEIENDQAMVEKSMFFREVVNIYNKKREYKVTCAYCHAPFVIELPEDKDGQKY